MEDTEKRMYAMIIKDWIYTNSIADPILAQVPLIKNPSYQPPKPITLNTNYNKLLPTLSSSVIPPKLNLSESDLENWTKEIEEMKTNRSELNASEDIQGFKDWIKLQQLKIAPGFSFEGIMTPNKAEIQEKGTKQGAEINELDKVFGKTTI